MMMMMLTAMIIGADDDRDDNDDHDKDENDHDDHREVWGVQQVPFTLFIFDERSNLRKLENGGRPRDR